MTVTDPVARQVGSTGHALRTRAMVVAPLVALCLLVSCTAQTEPKPDGDAVDLQQFPQATPGVSDADLLIPPRELSAALDAAASADPGTQNRAARSVARRITARLGSATGPARLRVTERALLESGVALYDGATPPTLVFAARDNDRPLFMQAAQVRLLAEADTGTTISSASLVLGTRRALRKLAPTASAQLSDAVAREFLLTALDGPVSGMADRVLRALLRAGDDTSGPTLREALATPGVEYALTPLQAQLLLVRVRADALLLVGLSRNEAGVPPAPDNATPTGPVAHTATFAAAADPCAIDAIPDFIYSMIASVAGYQLAKRLLPYLRSFESYAGHIRADGVVLTPPIRTAVQRWLAAMGIVSIAATLLNAYAMQEMFQGSVEGKPQPLQRTKSTTQDGDAIGLSAHFEWADRGVGASRWWNCMSKLASILGVDSVLTSPGPIRGSDVDWAVEGGPAKPAASAGSTDGDGNASIDLIGKRQVEEVPDDALLQSQPDLTVNAVVHPAKISALLLTVGTEMITGLLGGGIGATLAGIDSALKALMFALDRRGIWHADTSVQFVDWAGDQLILSYELQLSDKRQWAGPIAHFDSHGEFVLTGQAALAEGEPAGVLHYGSASFDSELFANNIWDVCEWPQDKKPSTGTCTVYEHLTGTSDGALEVLSFTDDGTTLTVTVKLSQVREANTRRCTRDCNFAPHTYDDQQAFEALRTFGAHSTKDDDGLWIIRLNLDGWDVTRDTNGTLRSATLVRTRKAEVGSGEVNLSEAWTLRPLRRN